MKRKGFSLIELLLYIGLLAVILTAMTNIFLLIVDLQLETESFSGAAQDGQYVLSRLKYDLSQGKTISSPALGGSGGSLTILINGVSYQYYLQNDNLFVNPGGQLNSYQTKVSDLLFTHLGNGTGEEDTVRINFTVTSRTIRRAGAEAQGFQTAVGLRSQL
ncbi:MAG: prepilin-type N-terminal cleavage/methylation domain-containing protein [Patescibacteria group bacterium]